MKTIYLIFFTLSFIISACRSQECSQLEVNFSPDGGAEQAIVREIDAANSDIQILAYSFTSKPIGDALLRAHQRGVLVRAVLDGENLGNPHSLLIPLAKEGVSCYIDKTHAIAHNKIMIIDESVVITGSYNFTKGASEKNAENSLIIKNNLPIVKKYLVDWDKHHNHSKLFEP